MGLFIESNKLPDHSRLKTHQFGKENDAKHRANVENFKNVVSQTRILSDPTIKDTKKHKEK